MSEKKIFKRKVITVEEKIHILNRLNSGERPSAIEKTLNINESTIRTIRKNENRIRKSVVEGLPLSAKRVARVRDNIKVRMEQALMIWIEDCMYKKIHLSESSIKRKALSIYEHLTPVEGEYQPFLASKGWWENFKRRNSLHNCKFRETETSFEVDKFTTELNNIINERGYTPEQIFNADEASMYWKKMPSRTYISQSEKLEPLDRITVLMCGNVSGECMLKPMIITRCINYEITKELPIYYRFSNQVWMVKETFEDWFYNCFVPCVELYLSEKGLDFKALLLIDSASSHCNAVLAHNNIEVIFFPLSCSALVQPLEQGIIYTFKTYYLRLFFETIFKRLEKNDTKTLTEIWREFSIVDCMNIIWLAYKEIKPKSFNACWKMILPQMSNKKYYIPSADSQYPRIIHIASRLSGEGLSDINHDDLEELLQDQALNEDELIELTNNDNTVIQQLTVDDIQTGIDHAKHLEIYFLEKDPSAMRSKQFQRDLQKCLEPYQQLLQQLQCQDVKIKSEIIIKNENI